MFSLNKKSIYERFPNKALLIRDLESIIKNPIFFVGLFIRIFIIIFHTAPLQNNLFLPFIINSIENISIDPWNSFILNGGNNFAFPYSILMIGILSPLVSLGNYLDQFLKIDYFASIGFSLTKVFFDFLLLICLSFLIKKTKNELLLLTYWLSPFVIYITYWHGQIDIIPVSIMFISLCFITFNKNVISAILLTLSIFCKYSMLLALPFTLIYIFKRRGFNTEFLRYIGTFLIISLVLFLPFSNLDGYKIMVMGSKEILKLYTLSLTYGSNLKLYITPLIYLVSVYLVWRLRRLTIDLFILSIGISFFTFLIFIPPAPAWLLWCIPFLTYYQIKSGRDIFILGFIFNIIGIINGIINSSYEFGLNEPTISFEFINSYFLIKDTLIYNSFFTAQQGIALLLSIRIYIYGLSRNSFYKISDEPILISLNGKSSNILLKISESCTQLFSRNLFKIEKASNFMNQFNYSFSNSIYKLNKNCEEDIFNELRIDEYLTSKNIRKEDFKNNFYNRVKSFIPFKPEYILLIENKPNIINYLRKIIKIRILISTELKSDYDFNLINQDSNFRTIMLYFSGLDKNTLNNNSLSKKDVKLTIYLPFDFIHDQLLRLTIAICPINVDSELTKDKKFVKMTFDGQPSSEDIEQMAKGLIPYIDDFYLKENSWQEGYYGIVQIVLLAYIAELLQEDKLIKTY